MSLAPFGPDAEHTPTADAELTTAAAGTSTAGTRLASAVKPGMTSVRMHLVVCWMLQVFH